MTDSRGTHGISQEVPTGRNVGQGTLAMCQRAVTRHRAFRLDHRLDCSKQAPACDEASRPSQEASTGGTFEGEPQSLFQAKGSGADVPLPTSGVGFQGTRTDFGQCWSDGRAFGSDRERAKHQASSEALQASGFGPTKEVRQKGRHRTEEHAGQVSWGT